MLRMPDQAFVYRDLWTELYETDGLEVVRNEVANSSLDVRGIGEALIKELEEKERLARQERREIEAYEINKKTLAAVQEGNSTQSWILVVLVLTIMVTIATCTAG